MQRCVVARCGADEGSIDGVMAEKKTGKKQAKVERREVVAKQVLRGLLRSQRECSIGTYLVLLELAGADGALSSTALERRVRCPGLQNARQMVSQARVQGWVARDEDGWRLTAKGCAVVAGLLVRLGVRSGFEREDLRREYEAGQQVAEDARQRRFDF